MVLLLRVFLIGIIFYLIFRSFTQHAENGNKASGSQEQTEKGKHISKKTGEYIDYEETEK